MQIFLGFYHEQSRKDRDQFVNILWDNMKGGDNVRYQFRKCTDCSDQDLVYDLDSLMHYTNHAFRSNWAKIFGLNTIEVKGDPNHVLAHSSTKHTFSPLDLKAILDLYECHGKNFFGDVISNLTIVKFFCIGN